MIAIGQCPNSNGLKFYNIALLFLAIMTLIAGLKMLPLHQLSLAIFNRQVLKNCDIKQAFVQSYLPDHEQYF
jgi:hypothetical protein